MNCLEKGATWMVLVLEEICKVVNQTQRLHYNSWGYIAFILSLRFFFYKYIFSRIVLNKSNILEFTWKAYVRPVVPLRF